MSVADDGGTGSEMAAVDSTEPSSVAVESRLCADLVQNKLERGPWGGRRLVQKDQRSIPGFRKPQKCAYAGLRACFYALVLFRLPDCERPAVRYAQH